MKKTRIKILSITLILILTTAILCSCSKSNDYAYPEIGGDAGSTITSPENSKDETIDTERKIIKTVNITAETKEFDKTVESVGNMVSEIGGYIERSSVSGNSIKSEYSSRTASYTLRIPADKLDEFTGNVENSVNVTNLSSTSEEITESYYDTVARLAVLQSQKDALQKMYDSFDEYSDMNDMLAVQDKLYDVIEEIESYQARLNTYDNKVEYSTVYISLYEVLEYSEIPTQESFGDRIGQSFKYSWINFWTGCQDFAVWFVGAIPTLIILGGIATAMVFIIRAIIKKKKARKAENDTKSE